MLRVLWPGRTRDAHLAGLIATYAQRIGRYAPFRLEELPAARGGRPEEVARREGERFLSRVPATALVVALDAAGHEMSSREFAGWLDRRLNGGPGEIAFLLGGHDGLSPDVHDRAGATVSLSRMTLTHEIARMLFLEQLYRAFTLIRGERYHH